MAATIKLLSRAVDSLMMARIDKKPRRFLTDPLVTTSRETGAGRDQNRVSLLHLPSWLMVNRGRIRRYPRAARSCMSVPRRHTFNDCKP